jgi:aspartyl-tRNA(Asn)/glutamyl-tRNA(Gln) amidotransferase subunit A
MARFDGVRFGHTEKADALSEYYLAVRSKGFGPEVKRRIMVGTYALSSGYFDAYYRQAQKVRALLKQEFEEAFKECDVILSPQ